MAERRRRGCAAATGREAQARNRYLSAFAFGGEQVEQHLPIRISQEFAGENRIARAAALEVAPRGRARERGAIERAKAENSQEWRFGTVCVSQVRSWWLLVY